MNASHFARVIEELCQLVGFTEPDILVRGGKLRVNDYLVSFIFDEPYDSDSLFVYVDMGPPATDSDETYKALLKINFELAAGTRGMLSIHPQSDRLFYSFCYTLNEDATGRHLLDTLIRFVGDVGVEALDLPQDVKEANEASAVAGRAKASRLFSKSEQSSSQK